MRHQRLMIIPMLAGVCLLTACADSSISSGAPVAAGICGPVDPDDGFTVRDSAGVRIVENLSPAWGDGDGLRVGVEPVALIGADESDPDDFIGRLAGAVLMDDGRVVVADASTREVRVHAPDGSFLQRFGGQGGGPGEFSRSIALYRGLGDTLVVAHEAFLKYARMLVDGTYIDGGYVTAPPGEAPVYHSLMQTFADGTLLIAERQLTSGSSEPETEVLRGTRSVWRLDRATGQIDSITGLLANEGFVYVHSPGSSFAGSLTFGDLPFGRRLSYALGTAHLYTGEGSHFQIERYRSAGGLTGLFRICEEPQPVVQEEVTRLIDELGAVRRDQPAPRARGARGHPNPHHRARPPRHACRRLRPPLDPRLCTALGEPDVADLRRRRALARLGRDTRPGEHP